VVLMVWRAWTEQEQAAFWSRYRAGSSLRSIGQALGHSMQTLRTLMKATGAVSRWCRADPRGACRWGSKRRSLAA
jgi:hypothetical protein